MKDFLRDVSRSVSGFNFEVIKVQSDAHETTFESVTPDRTLILKGKTKTPVQGFEGTIGLTNLSVLSGILNLSAMKDDSSSIDTQGRGSTPEELVFTAPNMRSTYRLMNSNVIPKQPTFKLDKFDVEIQPTKPVFNEFREQSGIFASINPKFKPKVELNKLVFCVGDTSSSTHSSEFTFSEVKAGTILKGGYDYPIAEVLKALRLMDAGACSLKISSMGALVVDVDTGISTLSFIFPGHS